MQYSDTFNETHWAPPWSSGSVLDHKSLPPVFESRRGHIWRLFRLSLRLITFGSRSAHLAYHVHKNGRKTSIIIIINETHCVWDYIQNSRIWINRTLVDMFWPKAHEIRLIRDCEMIQMKPCFLLLLRESKKHLLRWTMEE